MREEVWQLRSVPVIIRVRALFASIRYGTKLSADKYPEGEVIEVLFLFQQEVRCDGVSTYHAYLCHVLQGE